MAQQFESTNRTNGTLYLDAPSLAIAAAILASLAMLILGAFGAMGVYEGGVAMMQEWHLLFEPTIAGTILGMIEAAVVVAICTFVFATLYNWFAAR